MHEATRSDAGGSGLLGFRAWRGTRYAGLLVALLVLVLALSLLTPHFASYQNLVIVLRQISVLTILAIATTFIMIGGGLDLSIGATMVLGGIVAALILHDMGPTALPLAVLSGIAIGGLVGAFNGLLISRWKLNPLLVTIAVSLAVRGFAYLSTGGRLVGNLPDVLTQGMSMFILGVPAAFLLAIAVAAVVHVLVAKTVVGATIRGLGSNERAAGYLGIPVNRYILLIYVGSGVLAGIAAIVALGLGGSLSPSDYLGIELQAIAVSVIGGARFKGGVGSIPGTVIAAIFVGVVLNGLIHLGLPSSYLKLSNGTLLVLAVLVDSFRRRNDFDE